MKLWEARYGLVMLVGAETRAEAEENLHDWMEKYGLPGQWLIREVKDEGEASDCVGR